MSLRLLAAKKAAAEYPEVQDIRRVEISWMEEMDKAAAENDFEKYDKLEKKGAARLKQLYKTVYDTIYNKVLQKELNKEKKGTTSEAASSASSFASSPPS